MAKHIYRTIKDVQNTIRFVDAYNQQVPQHDTVITCRASSYIFRGSKRAFSAHLEMLNAAHGEGYALPE